MKGLRRTAVGELPSVGSRVVLAAIAGLVLLAGCGVTSEETPRALSTDSAPYRLIQRDPVPLPSGSARATVYLVRDTQLVPVARRTSESPDAKVLLNALLAGPTLAERERGISTAVPDAVKVAGEAVGGILTVDLPDLQGEAIRSDEVLGYAQLVLTLTRDPAVTGVLFRRDGKLLTVPRGDGSVTDLPLTRADYALLL